VPDQTPTTVPKPPEPPRGVQSEHRCRHRKAQEERKGSSATPTTPGIAPTSPEFPALPFELPLTTVTTVPFLPDSTIAGKCDSFVIDNARNWPRVVVQRI
jgi:hypothetical protein